MKSLHKEILQKNINSCLNLSKEHKYLIIYSNPIKSNEYLITIIYQKNYFTHKSQNKKDIDTDLIFILHLTHNFPINQPKLFCQTSLTHLGIELCDGKDILEEIIQVKWDGKMSAKNIILKIPNFIQKCLESKANKMFIGKYILEYEYEYNMLIKIPHQYFYKVEQIINSKSGLAEKRFLMITNLFFLIFSYNEGYFNYNGIKLVFFASLFSMIGIKRNEPDFEFEFSKNKFSNLSIYIKTDDGDNLLNILLFIFKGRGVDYLIQAIETSSKLPIVNVNNYNDNIVNNKNEIKGEND